MNFDLVKISTENVAPCQVKINIEVPQSEVKATYDQISGQVLKQAQLPGFRPGKAPKALVLKTFNERIMQEVSERVISGSYSKAFQEAGLEPAGYPTLDAGDIDINTDYSFSLKVETEPSFEVPDYKTLNLSRAEVVVEDSDVEAELDRFRESRKTYEAAEEGATAEAGDMVKVNYTGTLANGEEAAEDAATLLSAEGNWILLGEPEMLPGTATALVGVKVGDNKELTIDFPADFWGQGVAGKSADYKFEILEIQKASFPAIDDEMAKSAGAESLDALKETIKKHLESSRQYESEQELRNQLMDALIEKAGDFDVPTSQLEEEVKGETERNLRAQAQQGTEPVSTEEIEVQAKKRVQGYYLLRAIAKEEGIQVNEADIDGQLELLGTYRNFDPKLMKRKMMKDGRINGMAMDIALAKTMDQLVKLATGETEESTDK